MAIITCSPADGVGMRGGVDLVEHEVRRLDREESAVGHRVARVHHQVHDDLLELSRVDQ
jgi:hypothetical protein